MLKIAQPQSCSEISYLRRQPRDSRIDPLQTLGEQFNLLCVVDYECYPVFF